MIEDAPLIGYRCWRVDAHGMLLPQIRLLQHGDPWAAGTASATCMRIQRGAVDDRGEPLAHEAPCWGCLCGIYALHEFPQAQVYQPNLVRGVVKAWGRVIEHERGFRAQYARVIAMEERSHRPGALERLVADRYDVPDLPADLLASYASWHGTIIDEGRRAA